MWGTGGPGGFTLPTRRHTRARKAVHARRNTEPGTAWVNIAMILNVIAAALNLGSATLHVLPASPSPVTVVVICVSPSRALPTRPTASMPHAELGAHRGHITPRC